MENQLDVQVIPVGDEDSTSINYDLEKSPTCMASFYRNAVAWEKSSLSIKWNSTDRFFSVEFDGSGTIDMSLAELLSKKVPLQIAKTSTCECGSSLALGDFTVVVEDNDFRFKADYFCPACKLRLTAERKGLRKVLETWFTGLKKIEIKTTGVGLERS
ncbi:MAG: hypothetical protein JSS37_03435 [Proteobacteria bacterium]|nr:hypothetical protein [Pseudomonadota bacterium]